MSKEALADALKELIYEHYVFNRRIDELLDTLVEEPSKAFGDFFFF